MERQASTQAAPKSAMASLVMGCTEGVIWSNAIPLEAHSHDEQMGKREIAKYENRLHLCVEKYNMKLQL
jgi:hypothetical protein